MLYDYQCKKCERFELDVYRSIAMREIEAPICCEQRMSIVILQAPYGFVDNMEEYMCPVTNQGVTTRKQRNEIMAKEGLVDANDLVKTKQQRAKVQAEADAKREHIEKAKAEAPDAVKDQVNKWAKDQVYG